MAQYTTQREQSATLKAIGGALVLIGLLSMPVLGIASWLTSGLTFWIIALSWSVVSIGLLALAMGVEADGEP